MRPTSDAPDASLRVFVSLISRPLLVLDVVPELPDQLPGGVVGGVLLDGLEDVLEVGAALVQVVAELLVGHRSILSVRVPEGGPPRGDGPPRDEAGVAAVLVDHRWFLAVRVPGGGPPREDGPPRDQAGES